MVQHRGHTIEAHLSGWFSAHVYLRSQGRYQTIRADSVESARRMIDRALEEESDG